MLVRSSLSTPFVRLLEERLVVRVVPVLVRVQLADLDDLGLVLLVAVDDVDRRTSTMRSESGLKSKLAQSPSSTSNTAVSPLVERSGRGGDDEGTAGQQPDEPHDPTGAGKTLEPVSAPALRLIWRAATRPKMNASNDGITMKHVTSPMIPRIIDASASPDLRG